MTTEIPKIEVKPPLIGPAVTINRPPLISAGVNAATGKAMTIPKGITKYNTNSLDEGYFHAVVYSETSARKTTTAAMFGSRDDVRIILTRSKEQLIPLKDLDYEFVTVEDHASLMFALQFPEQLWPDWAGRPNRTLVLDDATRAVEMLLEEYSVIDGKEVKDRRRSYTAAKEDLDMAILAAKKKPQHLIVVALAKVKENPLTNEERIGPDLPPSMMSMILTEFEFVFYIKTSTWKMLTDRDSTTYTDTDPQTNKEKTYRREIFAKHKLPKGLIGKGIIMKEEPLDLLAVWNKIKAGKAAVLGAATLSPVKK